jgi:hypothetical protein
VLVTLGTVLVVADTVNEVVSETAIVDVLVALTVVDTTWLSDGVTVVVAVVETEVAVGVAVKTMVLLVGTSVDVTVIVTVEVLVTLIV